MKRSFAPLIALIALIACGPPKYEGDWEGEAQDCTLSGQDFPEDAYDVELSLWRDGDTLDFEYQIDDMFSTDLEIDDPEGDFFYSDTGFEITISGEAPVGDDELDMEVFFEVDYEADNADKGTGELELELSANGQSERIQCELELTRR